jgi:hypothetical protein
MRATFQTKLQSANSSGAALLMLKAAILHHKLAAAQRISSEISLEFWGMPANWEARRCSVWSHRRRTQHKKHNSFGFLYAYFPPTWLLDESTAQRGKFAWEALSAGKSGGKPLQRQETLAQNLLWVGNGALFGDNLRWREIALPVRQKKVGKDKKKTVLQTIWCKV